MSETHFVTDLAPLLPNYDGFLVDQFGVLHDGRNPLPGVVKALNRLRAAGKRVVVLSNSGKRAAVNEARMTALGLDRGLYTAMMSSGEVAWKGFRDRRDPPFASLGRSCLFFSRGGDRSAVEGLDLELVDDPASAEFVFLTGLDPEPDGGNRVQTLLSEARQLDLPLLCSNPDLTAVEGDRLAPGPGQIAQDYAAAGGRVHWVGKPAQPIYKAALECLGLLRSRVLAVGDSLDHDVAGAASAGLDSALLTSGIHRAAFGDAETPADRLHGLAELRAAKPNSPAPTWLMSGFFFKEDVA